MRSHYFKTRVTKMGQWATPPLDAEAWHGEESSLLFKKIFGIPKGLLALHTKKDGYMHMYAPNSFLQLLHKKIKQLNAKNYKTLTNKLFTFYPLVAKARTEVDKMNKDPKKLSAGQLVKALLVIRKWVHYITVFDQFSWLAEEYWTPLMRDVLEKKLSLTYGEKEYNRLLFALTKPEAISTTLAEKRNVIEQAIKIKNGKQTLEKASSLLQKKFGWLPIFNYGEAWQKQHYKDELAQVVKKDFHILKTDYAKLKRYSIDRNRNIIDITKKHKLNNKDLQIFIEFGLAIDTRNEAEYFASYAGQFLMPLFTEIRKRLYLSPKQLRELTEQEVKNALLGNANVEKILEKRGDFGGWGYDQQMKKQVHFSPEEAKKLFKYIESYVKPIQGGNETQGTCASPGRVTGKTRIVSSAEFNHKVKTGDILFTYATTTDYLPAMKRASAIVTEIGGLTCHAAVISREFGIPCVVALANAMKNFKDGDLVEVNADKGTVTKL